jgi:hypothetical protein
MAGVMRHVYLLGVTVLVFFSVSFAAAAGNLGLTQPPVAAPTVVAPPPANPVATGPESLTLKPIYPLYKQPYLKGEGLWVKQDLSEGRDSAGLIYRTFYRPSGEFPNAIVYMMLINMKHVSAKLYLGSAETYKGKSPARVEDSLQPSLVAVTNALWPTRHSGPGGVIFRGEVLKKMAPGVATIVFYKNGAVDVVEWSDKIPVSEVQDARQLQHLIAKDAKIVTTLVRRGRILSAEIGLGSLLDEQRPVIAVPASAPGEKPTHKLNFTSGDLWFLATRSAFGIRPDGNLVFAVGHHIDTSDLAKALVLAGCVRVIHADANPGNAVGIIYTTDGNGKIVKKDRLSPLQDKSTVDRYLKGTYPKDFVAFFRR